MTPARQQEVHAKIRALLQDVVEEHGEMTLEEAAQLLRQAEILDQSEIRARDDAARAWWAAVTRAAATLGLTPEELLRAVQDGDEAAKAAVPAWPAETLVDSKAPPGGWRPRRGLVALQPQPMEASAMAKRKVSPPEQTPQATVPLPEAPKRVDMALLRRLECLASEQHGRWAALCRVVERWTSHLPPAPPARRVSALPANVIILAERVRQRQLAALHAARGVEA